MGCCSSRTDETESAEKLKSIAKNNNTTANEKSTKHYSSTKKSSADKSNSKTDRGSTGVAINVFEESRKNSLDSKTIKKMSILFQKQSTSTIKKEKTEFCKLKKIEKPLLSFSQVDLMIYPNKGQTNTYIYVIKGDTIQFKANGLWKMLPYLDYVDSNGHDQYYAMENFGALLGRVGTQTFHIQDNTYFESTSSGILYIYPNIGKSLIEPSGALEVKVQGGHYFPNINSLPEVVKKEFPVNGYHEPIIFIGSRRDNYILTLEQGTNITLNIRGLWRLFSNEEFREHPYTDESITNEGFPLGSIIFDMNDTKLKVIDGLQFTVKESGTARIYPNVGNWILRPEGFIGLWIKLN